MKRILLQPAFVLHRRPYRETSFLIELFTKDYGRLSAIARGVRKNNSSSCGLVQPFIPLLVSLSGNGELMTLSSMEANGVPKQLVKECLFAGFYLNELLMCLLQKWDAHENLYTAYEKTLIALQTQPLEQKTLRRFEKCLLEELGYGPLPKAENYLHNTFSPDKYYRFVPEQGFVVTEKEMPGMNPAIFSGKNLLAIAKEDWQEEENVQAAKRLMRFILAPLLGSRPLYSRQFFK